MPSRSASAISLALSAALLGCTFDLPSPRPEVGAGGATNETVCLFDAGDSPSQRARALASDGTGELAVAGEFGGTMVFGSDTLENPDDDPTGFVARLDASCLPLPGWARAFTGPAPVHLNAVAMDADHVWCVGSFYEAVDFGDGVGLNAAATDNRDGYFIELGARSPSGPIPIGGLGNQEPLVLARRSDGTWLVAGYFGDQLRMGATELTTTGGQDAFLINLASQNPEPIWALSYGDAPSEPLADQIITQMALDASDNVIVAGTLGIKIGSTTGTLVLGGGCPILRGKGSEDIFVAKLDPQGTCIWATSFGAALDDQPDGIALDGNDVLLAGRFKQTVAFGSQVLTAPGSDHNAVLAKLDGNDGAVMWAYGFGDEYEQHGAGVAVDSSGNVIVAMDVDSRVDLDPQSDGGETEATGSSDVVLIEFDRLGNFVWGRRYGDAGAQYPAAVRVDDFGVAVVGKFEGTLGEGDAVITGDSLDDMFVMRVPH